MIERVVTAGQFVLDGQSWDVENNVWIVGDERDVLVVDAAHDATAIAAAVGDRRVHGIVLTHGHSDHIDAAPALAAAVGDAPVYLHPADVPLWRLVHSDAEPDRTLADGMRLAAGATTLTVLHTPGHSPGGCCLWDGGGTLFSGDTLFQGGPGNTSRSFSDFPTIIASIETKLLALPPHTVVHTGHGPDTTIGDEAPQLADWVARGY